MMGTGPWSPKSSSKVSGQEYPSTPIEYALRYAQLGWFVFPLVPGKKSPATQNGFHDATDDPAQIREWWDRNRNYGIGVAIKPSGLVVWDVDPRNGGDLSFDQILEARGPFADTAVARTGGGGTHHVFKAIPGLRKREFAKGVDLLADGYFIVEPTVHPSGAAYAWFDESDPLKGQEIAEAPSWFVESNGAVKPHGNNGGGFFGGFRVDSVRLPATGAPVPEGERNNALASLCGQWIAEGCTRGQVFDRAHAWNHGLESPLSEDEVDRTASSVCRGHNFRHPDAQVPVTTEIKVLQTRAVEPETSDEVQGVLPYERPIPGVLAQFVDYYHQKSVCHQPLLAVQTALALGSVVCGRRYISADLPNFSNLYYVCIAKSGTGKETIKTTLEAVLSEAGLGDLVKGSYTSQGGVFSALHKHPNHLSIVDEFGKHLDAGLTDRGNANFKGMITLLMEAWNRAADGVLRPLQYSEAGLSKDQQDRMFKPVIKPCLSLVGMTTPNTFYDSIGTGSVHDGYLNRHLIVHSDAERPKGLPRAMSVNPPAAVVDWAREASALPPSAPTFAETDHADSEPFLQPVPMTDEAYQLFDQCAGRAAEKADSLEKVDLSALPGRTAQKAIRVGLILAVSKNRHKPVIDHECAQWACDYVEWADNTLASVVISEVVEGRLGKLIKRVSDYILKGAEKGKTLRELKRAYGGHGRDLEEVIKIILASGKAVFGEVETGNPRGRKREAYVNPTFLTATDITDE